MSQVRLRIFFTCTLSVIWSPFTLAADELQGDPELFRLVAVNIQENVDKIQRWKGKLTVSESIVDSGGAARSVESDVSFAWDQQSQSLRWSWNCKRYIVDGEDITGQEGISDSVSGLIKEGVFYRAVSNPPSARGQPNTVVIHADSPFSFGPESTDFDPMYCFSDQGEPLVQRFERLYRRATAGNAKLWSVGIKGKLVIARADAELRDGLVSNIYTFNLDQGGCLTSYENTDPEYLIDLSYGYEDIDGCWLPKDHRYHRSAVEGKSSYIRKVHWTENIVNWNEGDISDDFSLASIGIVDGDRVKDSRAGTQYTVGGKEAARSRISQNRHQMHSSKSGSSRPWLMLANITIVIFGALIWFFKRRVWADA